MVREKEHKCKEMPPFYEIFDVDNRYILTHTINDTYIKGVSFCPWCGIKLGEK